MKTSQDQNQAVILFQTITQRLAERLPEKTKPFFLALMLGALLAIVRRRTVTKWLMAAQICDDYQKAPKQLTLYHIPHIGRKGTALLDENLQANLKRILEELGEVLETADHIRMVLDDSPTKRYGLKIEGIRP